MIASDAIIKSLEKEGVDIIFGYSGAAVCPIYESLRNSNIEHILVRNEQSAAHNASGYARVSGKAGVCIVTSGPGATNILTGIATAYMDSVPMVIITGQVGSKFIGKDVFQEIDTVGTTESFTKHNYLVKNAEDLPRIIKESFYIARTGRPGPVLIDIPLDIQKQQIDFNYPTEVDIRGYKPTSAGHARQIKRAIKRIKGSKKPVVCAGGGVLLSGASKELRKFIKKINLPAVVTLMGIGSVETNSENYCGMVGSHGQSYANKIVSESDLIIAIGTRIADRSTISQSARDTAMIHIDIDEAEIGKNLDVDIPVVGDAKNILNALIEGTDFTVCKEWLQEVKEIKSSDNGTRKKHDHKYVNPWKVIRFISDIMDDSTILVGDVGQNQMWCARNFEIKGDRRFLTSGGLGTMGCSLPFSIGAKFGVPHRTVISAMGDGGLQMLIAELGVLRENKLNIKIILFNNQRLGMVRELQEKQYGKGCIYGVVFEHSPDFVKIAEGFGIKGIRVISNEEFEKAFKDSLDMDEAFFIEVVVDPDFSTI